MLPDVVIEVQSLRPFSPFLSLSAKPVFHGTYVKRLDSLLVSTVTVNYSSDSLSMLRGLHCFKQPGLKARDNHPSRSHPVQCNHSLLF